MKTTSKELKDNKVEISVKFTKDEISDGVKKKYQEFAKKYKFPGFRPGHAPRPVIDSAMGGRQPILATMTDELVNYSCPRAIDKEVLNPIGKPDFGDKDVELVEDGKAYNYKFVIEVAPKYELDNYDAVSIEMPEKGATVKEIDSQIENYRQNYFSFEDAPASTKASDDSTVILKISAKDDAGKEIKSLTNDKMNYHLGSKFLPEDFEKKIIGAKKGDKKKFKIAIPDQPTVYTTSLMDKTKNIDFNIEIKTVQKKVLPKLTDEWVEKNIGFKSVDELRQQIKEQIEQEKERMEPILKEYKCLTELIKRFKGDAPKELVDKKEAELLTDFFTQLQQSGMTYDQYLAQYQMDAKKFKEDVKKQATDVVLHDLALDSWAAKKGFTATDKEVESEFKKADPEHWEKLLSDCQDRGDVHVVRQAILRMKAAKDLVDSANISIEKPKNSKAKKQTTTKKSKTEKTTKKSK